MVHALVKAEAEVTVQAATTVAAVHPAAEIATVQAEADHNLLLSVNHIILNEWRTRRQRCRRVFFVLNRFRGAGSVRGRVAWVMGCDPFADKEVGSDRM